LSSRRPSRPATHVPHQGDVSLLRSLTKPPYASDGKGVCASQPPRDATQLSGMVVQQQHAATRAVLADCIQPLPALNKSVRTFNQPYRPSYGSGGGPRHGNSDDQARIGPSNAMHECRTVCSGLADGVAKGAIPPVPRILKSCSSPSSPSVTPGQPRTVKTSAHRIT